MTNSNNHVYILDTSQLNNNNIFEFWYKKMPDKRKNKIDSFRFKKDKNLSLGAGIVLLNGFERAGIFDPELVYNKNEKPSLAENKGVFFNISHSGERVVCAFSNSEIGIDIETIQHFEKSLREHIYLKNEIEHINALHDPDLGYTNLWTIKESLMKYLGTGLSLPPDKIYIDFNSPITASCEGYETSKLSFTQYNISGYCITVCSEHPNFADELEWIML